MAPAEVAGSPIASDRQPSIAGFRGLVRLPIRVHLLRLGIDVAADGERVFLDLWRAIQVALGRVEHKKVCVFRGFEVVPGNRDMRLVKPEYPASGDHQIRDLAGLRAQYEIIDAAERQVVRAAHFDPEQLVGAEGDVCVADRHRGVTRQSGVSALGAPPAFMSVAKRL